MKIVIIISFSIFCIACGPSKENSTPSATSQVTTKKISKSAQQKRVDKKPAKAAPVDFNTEYYMAMKKATGMNDKQIKEFNAISVKYQKQRRTILAKPDYEHSDIKKLNQVRNDEQKDYLGQELYDKKMAFEQNWRKKKGKK